MSQAAASAESERRGAALSVDVTDLLEYLVDNDILHGVQNVVMSLVRSLHGRAADSCRLVGFHPIYGRPFELPLAALPAATLQGVTAFKAQLGIDGSRPVRSPQAIRSRHAGRPVRQAFEFAKHWLRRTARRLSTPAAALRFLPDTGGARFAAGDVLLMPGLNVWYPEYNALLAGEARRQGAHVAVVVHDLGPLTAPEYFPAEYTTVYRAWLDGLLPHTDLFICDSAYTDSALRRLLEGRGAAIPSRVVPLAHELPQRAAEPVRPQIEALCATDFVLCVGRIEPRKNLTALVKTWTALAQTLGPGMPTLVLAGRANSRAVVAEIEAAAAVAPGLVRFAESPNDSELARLYGACRFAVYPSLHEGWGLPVGEAACFGKLTAASSATSIPEVVGPLAVYFDPQDAAEMRGVLHRLLSDPAEFSALQARLMADFRPRSWAEVAAATLAAIEAQFGATPARPDNDRNNRKNTPISDRTAP
jgi:glycosyltransferase involved in cell wall biosynthesis